MALNSMKIPSGLHALTSSRHGSYAALAPPIPCRKANRARWTTKTNKVDEPRDKTRRCFPVLLTRWKKPRTDQQPLLAGSCRRRPPPHQPSKLYAGGMRTTSLAATARRRRCSPGRVTHSSAARKRLMLTYVRRRASTIEAAAAGGAVRPRKDRTGTVGIIHGARGKATCDRCGNGRDTAVAEKASGPGPAGDPTTCSAEAMAVVAVGPRLPVHAFCRRASWAASR
jgi:hypothetical protein